MENKTPSTGGQSAPEITAPVYQAPVRRKTIERQGGATSPRVARWPFVRGGVASTWEGEAGLDTIGGCGTTAAAGTDEVALGVLLAQPIPLFKNSPMISRTYLQILRFC